MFVSMDGSGNNRKGKNVKSRKCHKNKPISKSQETNVMLVSDLLNILVYFS